MDRMSRLIVTEGTILTISRWIALAKSVQEMQEFNDRANIYHSTMLIQHGEAASDGENMRQQCVSFPNERFEAQIFIIPHTVGEMLPGSEKVLWCCSVSPWPWCGFLIQVRSIQEAATSLPGDYCAPGRKEPDDPSLEMQVQQKGGEWADPFLTSSPFFHLRLSYSDANSPRIALQMINSWVPSESLYYENYEI